MITTSHDRKPHLCSSRWLSISAYPPYLAARFRRKWIADTKIRKHAYNRTSSTRATTAGPLRLHHPLKYSAIRSRTAGSSATGASLGGLIGRSLGSVVPGRLSLLFLP